MPDLEGRVFRRPKVEAWAVRVFPKVDLLIERAS
jgi:hypothetical protein